MDSLNDKNFGQFGNGSSALNSLSLNALPWCKLGIQLEQAYDREDRETGLFTGATNSSSFEPIMTAPAISNSNSSLLSSAASLARYRETLKEGFRLCKSEVLRARE